MIAVHRTCAPALLWLAAAIAPMAAPAAGLGYREALEIARLNAPALRAQQATLAADTAAQPAAASLPDPRLSVGIENLPVTGPDRYSVTRDFMTRCSASA